MKKPNLKNLKIDKAETNQIRSAMTNQKSVKITININAETLAKLRDLAERSGVPYQRLINRTLSESLNARADADSRLDRIEKELGALKKKIAA